MKAIVLIKQTPDTAKLGPGMDAPALMADGGPRILNPWDEYSLETGISLAEDHMGDCTALSLGKPEAAEALKTGLAMGAKEAVLLTDPAFDGGDSLATARVLAAAINKIGAYDIILAGKSAIDGGTAQTAVQVAALLDLPYLGYVSKIRTVDFNAKTITVERAVKGGREIVTAQLPAVVSVLKEIGEPRYPSFMGIRKAARAKIPQWGLADLELTAEQVGAAGSQMSWPAVTVPPAEDVSLEMIDGSPRQAAETLLEKLIAKKVL